MGYRTDNYIAVLLEQIRGQNKAILEGNLQIHERLEDMVTKDEHAQLKQSVGIIKAVVTDISRQLTSHETRIARLESSTYWQPGLHEVIYHGCAYTPKHVLQSDSQLQRARLSAHLYNKK